MATNRTMQTGDTYPPVMGLASDEDGPVDLPSADSLRAILLSETNVRIILPAIPIDPILIVNEGQPNEERYNWEAGWTSSDDSEHPGVYRTQLEVTWAPGQVEKFPNSHAGAPTVTIEQGNT